MICYDMSLSPLARLAHILQVFKRFGDCIGFRNLANPREVVFLHRSLSAELYREVGDGRNRRWGNEGSAVASVVARGRPRSLARCLRRRLVLTPGK